MKAINVPTKIPDLRRSVVIVDYNRDMWRKRPYKLSPLPKPCSMKVKFKWTDIENNAFIATKKIVGADALISYPNFIKKFIIHTYARKTQLGGVISQDGNPSIFLLTQINPCTNILYEYRKRTFE